jgi:hypothetical protein
MRNHLKFLRELLHPGPVTRGEVWRLILIGVLLLDALLIWGIEREMR